MSEYGFGTNMPNFFDTYYGNGLGAGQQQSASQRAPMSNPAPTTSGGYVPPSPQTQQAQNQNMTDSDWMDLAKFGYAVYKDKNPSKPNFQPVPLSPEQKQLYEVYLKSIMNPATANNASALNDMASQMLGGFSNMRWQSPRTFSGDTGYSGSSMAFNPPSAYRPLPESPQGPPSGGFGGGPDSPPPFRPDSGYSPRGGPGGGLLPPVDVTGRQWAGQQPQQPGAGFFGNDPNFMNRVTRVAGAWNKNEETYERWIARGLSLLLAAVGVPIPPGVLDKGIDGVQWVYRKFFGGGGGDGAPPQSPMDVLYNLPKGQSSPFGSAYGRGQRPPGLIPGNKPASGYGVTGGQNAPFAEFGRPGSVAPPPPPQTGYKMGPGGVVYTADGRYAGGGDSTPRDSTLVPFGGSGNRTQTGGGFLPQNPTSDPIDPRYTYGYR